MKARNHIPDPFIEIGLIRKAWGLKGHVKVTPSSDYVERFLDLKHITLIRNGDIQSEHDVEDVQIQPRNIVVKFQGVDSAAAADELRNMYICVHESESVRTDEWEFFHHQLVGLTVKFEDGRELGVIERILETGANDVYVVKRRDGGELLIPAVRHVIQSIDLQSSEMIVVPEMGMCDE